MENYVGKICPFCKTAIAEFDEVKVCPACGIPHHAGCWEENRGCTTFGCSEQYYEAQHTNPTDVCANCGAPLGDGQAFCPRCGTSKASVPNKNICSNCGAVLQDNQAFCDRCGHKAGVAFDNNVNAAINQFNANIDQKKKKGKTLPIVIAIILVVAAIFGGITYSIVQEKKEEEEEQARQEAIEEYIENAQNFYTMVLESGSTMEDIGNEIQTAWTAYVNSKYYNGKKHYSVDSAIAAAQVVMLSDITDVEDAHDSIEALYKELLTVPDTRDQELAEIKAAVKTAYDAYQDMYDCVISPSGNYNTWTDEFGDVDSDLAEAIGDLRVLLD